jgi:lactate racemase
MQSVSVPWSMWYENTTFELTFPDSWELHVAEMKGGPEIGDEGIRKALAEPIGAPPLREVARGRRDAAILIDDLTRPTPSYRLLPYILEELAAGGLGDDRVRIVCALAAHRPMTRNDFLKKIGPNLLERLEIINHNAMDCLEFYGHSSDGTPIWVNRDFARSDLKIAAGMITPRGRIFGGGAKLLLPGACGRETILVNHRYCAQDALREQIDEVADLVGLEYIVNPLLNAKGEIMAMVAGHYREAYWHGVEIGKELYRTEVPEGMDIVVANAWPKDTEATQAGMAMVPLHGTHETALKEGGTAVITAACPEGLGFHSVLGPGTLLRERSRPPASGRRVTRPPERSRIIFSPNLNKYDVRNQFGEDALLCKTWPEVLQTLQARHGNQAKVSVFPCGSIQYGVR